MKISREEALRLLREKCNTGDVESDHANADAVLLELIDDDEIQEAYDAIDKWYA